MAHRSGTHRSGNWWKAPTSGISLCGIMRYGEPVHADLFGSHLLSDLGAGAIVVGLFAVATIWMFRRWGASAARPTIPVAESEALWSELEQAPEEHPEPTAV